MKESSLGGKLLTKRKTLPMLFLLQNANVLSNESHYDVQMEQVYEIIYNNEFNPTQNKYLSIKHCSLYKFIWFGRQHSSRMVWVPIQLELRWPQSVQLNFLGFSLLFCKMVMVINLSINIQRNNASENFDNYKPLQRWYLFYLGVWNIVGRLKSF